MPDDIFLICSKGIYEYIESISILNMLTTNNTIQKIGSKLIKYAIKRGSKDNITFMIVKISNDLT